MAPQDILALAKQGDPKTIADLLNHSFRPRGITAYVLRQGDRLHITLESPQTFNREVATAFIHKRLQSLKIEPIKTVVIDGPPTRQGAIAWQQEVDLQPHQNPPPSSTMQESSFSSPSAGEDEAETHALSDRSPPPSTDSAAPPTMMNSEDIALPLGSETALADEATVNATVTTVTIEPTPAVVVSSPAGAIATPVSQTPPSTAEPDILQRPEAAILLVFAVLVLLWDLYLELADDISTTAPLSGRALARRLGVASSTLGRRRDRPDFDLWTQDLDPDGVAWIYQDGQYVPKVI